jgi:hypothetical protein
VLRQLAVAPDDAEEILEGWPSGWAADVGATVSIWWRFGRYSRAV